MRTKKLRAPHGWVGGKSKLAKDIVGMIPNNHRLFVEVFGGALNILYAKEPSQSEIVNDLNQELINLHRTIRNNPSTLAMYLNELLVSRDIFYDIKKGTLKPRSDIEKAAFYYYILAQSFGSRGNTFAMTCKSKKAKNIYKDFSKWSQRLKGVTIENLSFEELINNYDKEDVMFYCDPPYLEAESYYKNINPFGIKEHKLLAKILSNIKGKFLLSYNDHPIIKELYKDFNIINSKEIEYTLGRDAHGKSKKVSEIFICNYDINGSRQDNLL
jgi:DNA adenine methylase